MGWLHCSFGRKLSVVHSSVGCTCFIGLSSFKPPVQAAFDLAVGRGEAYSALVHRSAIGSCFLFFFCCFFFLPSFFSFSCFDKQYVFIQLYRLSIKKGVFIHFIFIKIRQQRRGRKQNKLQHKHYKNNKERHCCYQLIQQVSNNNTDSCTIVHVQ